MKQNKKCKIVSKVECYLPLFSNKTNQNINNKLPRNRRQTTRIFQKSTYTIVKNCLKNI